MTVFSLGAGRCLIAVGVLATAAALTPRPAFADYQEVPCERNFMKGWIELDAKRLDWIRSRHMSYRIISEQEEHPVRSRRPDWVFGTCLIEAWNDPGSAPSDEAMHR